MWIQIKNKEHLKEHKKSSHENGTYPCDKCKFWFENKEHLKTHIESVHGDT